jgi:hypothetical protein
MSEYGQIINPEYDPSKNHIYESFTEYFNNPVLTKIKNVNGYSVYMVKIHAMLGNAFRYLILFVARDVNITGHSKKMEELEWISLQTRTLEDHHDIKSHTYKPTRITSLSQQINVQTRSETQTTYHTIEYPLVITLLHTRKNNSHQYQPTGTIVSALETFQTIINYREGDTSV